ncbi:MAG: response regulator [Deltaproteobacteria bacterium]|nr:response regulator [Candidatus Anaeroferrophillacea bacterium]
MQINVPTEAKRLLIVDDSSVIREGLAKQLGHLPIDISLARDGQEALDMIAEGDFDLVITDVDMPRVTGIELCRRLKANRHTCHLPVVILSTLDDNEDIEQGFLVGAAAYLSKSEARQVITETIERVLRKASLKRNQIVLVVDDSPTIRAVIDRGLREAGFAVITAGNGRQALELMRRQRPAMILSDINMPEMDGLEFCRMIHADRLLADIPFVAMSTNRERPLMRRMLQCGADAYLTKPFNTDELVITIEKLLSDRLLLAIKEKERLESERSLMLASITSLGTALEARDPYTRGHSEAVARITTRLAAAMNMAAGDLETIQLGGMLHDIGKIGVTDHILLKPGKLTDSEYDAIKRHPSIGGEILRPVPSLAPILPIVIHHHERFDGRGYPDGLKGERIPLWARLTAIADTYHALTSDRPYRRGMAHDRAMEIVMEVRGTQLCPDCVDLFLAHPPHPPTP